MSSMPEWLGQSPIEALSEHERVLQQLRRHTNYPTSQPRINEVRGQDEIVWLRPRPSHYERDRIVTVPSMDTPITPGMWVLGADPPQLRYTQHAFHLHEWMVSKEHTDSVNYDAEQNIITITYHRVMFVMPVWREQ